jgi:nucleoside diphosphate kinase
VSLVSLLGQVSEIVSRFSRKGYKLVAIKLVDLFLNSVVSTVGGQDALVHYGS